MSTRISTPGRSASPGLNNQAVDKGPSAKVPCKTRGLTLIELMVAMAIVGLLFVVAASSLRSVFNVNLKSGARRLAATLRYLSNKAVTDHLYLRLVLDLDGQTYHLEESPDPLVISPEKETEKGEKTEKGNETGEKKEGDAAEDENATGAEKKEETHLPSGVFFKDASVSYLPRKSESGQVSVYFFPDGFATGTLVNLKDEEDQDHYSVELLPLSGKVKVEGEYKESLSEESKK